MNSTTNRTRRIFISDLHMGDEASLYPPPPPPYPYSWGWLSKERTDLLADFLEKEIIESGDVKELIILGDLLDHWVRPAGLTPTDFETILSAPHNVGVAENLKRIASPEVPVDLYYAPGNHDMLLEKAFMESHFPGIHFCEDGDREYVGVYTGDGIGGEHGSQYNFFCAPNPGHAGDHWLPIGFFMSRSAAEGKAARDQKPNFLEILSQFASQFLKKPELVKDLFISIAEGCGLDKGTSIDMEGLNHFGPSVTVEEVGDTYADLFRRWDELKPNGISAVDAISTELAGFRGMACKMYFQTGKARIAVFGHTHHAMMLGMDYDGTFFHTNDVNGCGYIYANSGTWINGHECTYIETEVKGDRHFVRLCEYTDDRKPKKQKERFIYI
jgi:UDP-2,3-diacylglucosamine pyrophosphatase LpxH